MAATPPTPASPVGEDNWVDYIDQQSRHADSLELRIRIVELYRAAVNAEPGSLTVWLAYCDYFWSLYQQCQHHPRRNSQDHDGSESPAVGLNWSAEELQAGRDIFSLDTALHLWSEGHEATMYRVNDSHRLWNRWISLEKDLLDSTRTPEGVRRITHLYRNRLSLPHVTWDQTSQMFSSFLSEYNPSSYESIMKEVTECSKDAKQLYDERDRFEMSLLKAESGKDVDAQMAVMLEYLTWEQGNSKRQRGKQQSSAISLCLGLFSRALSGLFVTEETVWNDYVVWVSTLRTVFTNDSGKKPTDDANLLQLLPNSLDILQRAALHCPWSGSIWARYILSGEEAGLAFHDMERIKHAATNSSQLDRDGMTAVVDMYAAWCGYLKRTAMDPDASDESTDIADSGLLAALEAVQVWGERRFGDEYQGDPSYRLERITIQYLTEKHGAIDDARGQWQRLAKKSLYANSYDFVLHYFLWEMMVFQLQKSKPRSPTPGNATARASGVPEIAAQVLERALHNQQLDWPERILEVYLHHCNDYQTPETLRRALDTMHKTKKILAKRRERDAQNAAAAYASEQASAAAAGAGEDKEMDDYSPSGTKRKHGEQDAGGHENDRSKRARTSPAPGVGPSTAQDESQQPAAKRDRENCSVIVQNLPRDTTLTSVRKYFKEFGHINNAVVKQAESGNSSIAFVEFRSPEDVRSAMIRDGKYFGDSKISIKPATGMIVFVTNFPPEADDAFIRDLFKDCGYIFSTRWPSLKYNASRRFCYVTFLDPKDSAKAIKLHGRILQDKFKLQVQYSDPRHKQDREGATEEGREIVVKNLAHSVDEANLESVFGKFGDLSRVRLLRNVEGVSRGSAFIVFKSKDQAQTAIAELDNTNLNTHIIKVELATPSNYRPTARFAKTGPQSLAPGNGDGDHEMADHDSADKDDTSTASTRNDRTFALLDVSDTVNVARLRALVEEHGELVKLVLNAKQGGAIVEMKDIAAVGKAQLSVDGVELDGQKIRTGTVAELFQKKSKADTTDGTSAQAKKTSARALMPPPHRVSRPTLGRGGKRGLGFVGSKMTAGAKGNDEATTNGLAETTTKKSNAGFREMFLGSTAGSTDKESAEPAGGDKVMEGTSQNGHSGSC